MATLPEYKEALASALSVVQQVSCAELVSLNRSLGRFVAENIIADRDLPPFNRSQMDGYAVVASEVASGETMQVIAQVSAGTTFEGEHKPNTCVVIATGAPVPDCFDAIVQHELTDNGTKTVTFLCTEVAKGKAIHLRGVDAKSGDVLVPKHTQLAPQHIGIAASVGVHLVAVLSKPKVIVLTSGDEVVAPSQVPKPHQIRNGNNAMVSAMFVSLGCEVVEMHHVLDDLDATNKAMATALDGRCDLVVTIGGISAGKRDFFPRAFAASDVTVAVKGVSIQPGKPVIVGRHENAVVLGLPGNPVSALACACVFGWPIVRSLHGMDPSLHWQQAPLASHVRPNLRRLCFRPCLLVDGKVTVPLWQGSGDLVHTSTTHGLVQLPSSAVDLQAGDLVSCLAYPFSK
ncbi:MAG: molybdopterin molybdotransferase MoeA [Phycisphaerales bacterium]|jgi:molybdopterin molybdotransferase